MRAHPAFPGYPLADLPPIPPGFRDVSFREDACPSFLDAARGLRLWIDFADPSRREHDGPRFVVAREAAPNETILESEDWSAVLRFLDPLARQS